MTQRHALAAALVLLLAAVGTNAYLARSGYNRVTDAVKINRQIALENRVLIEEANRRGSGTFACVNDPANPGVVHCTFP